MQSGQRLGWRGGGGGEDRGEGGRGEGEASRVDPWSGVTDSPASW